MGRKILVPASLVFTIFAALVFTISSSVSAAGNTNGSITLAANVVTTSAITVEINSQATNVVSVDVTPINGAAFKESDEATFTIASNNRTGIQASMVVDSPNLIHSTDSSYYISSLAESASGYTASDFPANTWGIALKNGSTYNNYFGISAGVTPILETNTPATSPQAFKIGTKIDTSLIPGEYSTTVSIVAVAKPYLYMQDVMYWKDTVNIGESFQVIDSRDMKTYWISRIETDPTIPDSRADCTGTGASRVCSQLWMTQNLDLDLTAGTKTFTHTDTDLGWSNNDKDVVWTSQIATYTYVSDFFWAQNKEELSFDFGDKYMYGNIAQYNSLQQCLDAGLTKEECEHYHSGNLYNFYAATVQSATSGNNPITISNDNYTVMPNSICPAGWRLPAGLTQDGVYSDVDFALHYNGVTATNSATLRETISYTTADGYTEMVSQPFWFTTTGGISQDRVQYHVLNGGLYWYDTITQDNGAERLFFSPDAAYPALTGQRGFGHTVRCIAR